MVSIFGEHEPYRFPDGFDNEMRLKDLLEHEVDEKFYISGEKVEKLISQLDGRKTDAFGIDLTINEPKERDIANCIKARYDAGVSNFRQDGTGVAIPCLTPDRIEKRQNGRRFKENSEPMFTLTGQDRHGILEIQGPNEIKQIGNIVDTGNWGNPQRGRAYGTEGCSPALNTVGGGGLEPKIITHSVYVNKKYDEFIEQNGYIPELFNPYNCQEIKEITPTQTTSCGSTTSSAAVLKSEDLRIRKLTPLECWRLMGFDDEHFKRAADSGVSNSQLYKQAGNSIVVDVLEHIFMNLFNKEIL